MKKSEEHARTVQIRRIRNGAISSLEDEVIVEEPLEIRLGFRRKGRPRQQPISITMRTPGDDFELALGFLFGERILNSLEDVVEAVHCGDDTNQNVVRVELDEGVDVDLVRLQRNFYTTSSCGVCGKSSLEALEMTGYEAVDSAASISADVLQSLPGRLLDDQSLFERTGGLHATGLFDCEGNLLLAREDVGRHNAMDKLVGACWKDDALPLRSSVVVLSGRASFELLQKAVAAGAPIVAAVGAPSSLAVEVARAFGVTLCGFVRQGRCNIYTHAERVT